MVKVSIELSKSLSLGASDALGYNAAVFMGSKFLELLSHRHLEKIDLQFRRKLVQDIQGPIMGVSRENLDYHRQNCEYLFSLIRRDVYFNMRQHDF